jgi:hypothetical protein
MSNNLFDEYSAAVAQGNTGYADYLSNVLNIGTQQYGSEFASNVGGAPSATTPGTTSPTETTANPTAAPQGLFGSISSALAPWNPFNPQNSIAGNVVSGVGSVAAGAAGSALNAACPTCKAATSFITDIPRVATTFIGALLIIAGLIALATHHDIIVNPLKS